MYGGASAVVWTSPQRLVSDTDPRGLRRINAVGVDRRRDARGRSDRGRGLGGWRSASPATSDGDGRAELRVRGVGTYRVTVTAHGYDADNDPIQGIEKRVVLHLTPTGRRPGRSCSSTGSYRGLERTPRQQAVISAGSVTTTEFDWICNPSRIKDRLVGHWTDVLCASTRRGRARCDRAWMVPDTQGDQQPTGAAPRLLRQLGAQTPRQRAPAVDAVTSTSPSSERCLAQLRRARSSRRASQLQRRCCRRWRPVVQWAPSAARPALGTASSCGHGLAVAPVDLDELVRAVEHR